MQIETVSISGNLLPSSSTDTSASGIPAAAISSETEKEEKVADKKKLEIMAAELQETLEVFHNVKLKFAIHDASDQVIVIVTDESTGEIIREIPSREILDLSAKMEEMMGMLFDRKI